MNWHALMDPRVARGILFLLIGALLYAREKDWI